MTKTKLTAIIKQIDSFPSLPATVTRVMQVTADPESSANDLMRAVLPDQSMCATILKIANSAFFGLPREVTSMEKAVTVLGFNEIHNIVLGKAVFNSFQKLNKENKTIIDAFWGHSFKCGLAAKIIAHHSHLSEAEFFIAGLIHDIGKLAIFMTFPSEYTTIFETSGPVYLHSFLQEEDTFGIRHDKVGMRLLQRWLFPDSLVQAIGYHHQPDETEDRAFSPLIIQLADMLAHMQEQPGEIDSEDVTAIMHDLNPEISTMWQQNNLSWQEDDIKIWMAELDESCHKDAAILDSFIS